MIGKRYERYVILSDPFQKGSFTKFVKAKCDCGSIKIVQLGHLKSGHSKSCGCLSSEMAAKRSTKHGKANTREYMIWGQMKQRCYNKNHKNYHNYGGRGITICERWVMSFDNFYKDMGNKPEGLSLDRINVNENYEKSNCRWANQSTQCLNRRDYANTSSKYRGVYFRKSKCDWVSTIKVNGKIKYIGLFKTEIDAAKAFNAAVIKYRPEGSPLNKIPN